MKSNSNRLWSEWNRDRYGTSADHWTEGLDRHRDATATLSRERRRYIRQRQQQRPETHLAALGRTVRVTPLSPASSEPRGRRLPRRQPWRSLRSSARSNSSSATDRGLSNAAACRSLRYCKSQLSCINSDRRNFITQTRMSEGRKTIRETLRRRLGFRSKSETSVQTTITS